MTGKVARILSKAENELKGETYVLVAWNGETKKWTISSGRLEAAKNDANFKTVK